MPYADNSHSYWSGYFVSRSTLKGFVRYSSHILHATTALVSTSQVMSNNLMEMIFNAQAPNGVTTHHDAVSGTEQQHVADDYAKNLNIANTINQQIISDVCYCPRSKVLTRCRSLEPSFLPRAAPFSLSALSSTRVCAPLPKAFPPESYPLLYTTLKHGLSPIISSSLRCNSFIT